jgi:hypothetical protein
MFERFCTQRNQKQARRNVRLLAIYARVSFGIGSLALTGCSGSSGDEATGNGPKGGSGNVAGSAGGGAAGGGAAGGGAAGGGAAGDMSEIGIFGEADGRPFSLTKMVICAPLTPGLTLIEASLSDDAAPSPLMHMMLMANAPGSLDCETGSSIAYAPNYFSADPYFLATQGVGTCAITLTEMPMARGDSMRGTFTASLEPQSGTGPGVTISNGRFSATLQ